MTSIAIIGSGFGGLGMAIQLARAGFDDFTIFEKSDRLGGTWRDNAYPGAACDVPSHLYSFSFERKHDWTRRFAEQPEILAYLEACADKHGLRPRIRHGVEITAAAFDEEAACWRLTSARGETFTADVLVTACGQLNRPAIPRLRGAFAGPSFHSARWDPAVSLDGKRVAVIGTGASAIQFVPHVAARAARLVLFQRSPPWILPKPDGEYSPVTKTFFRVAPGLELLHRFELYWRLEWRLLALQRGGRLNALLRRFCERHLRDGIPDEARRAALTPDYPPGCKRILISNDYYPALARDNVELVTDEIDRLEAGAVLTRDGRRHPADVLIYGTGFHSTDFLAPMAVTGRAGCDLNAAWRDGAEAYLGITLAGFPNFFMLYGPNTNLAHNSIIFMLESQIAYVLSCLRALRAREARAIELRAERSRSYNDRLAQRLDRSIWTAGCSSWYQTSSGKQTNNWPGFTVEYRFRTRRADLGDYVLT